MKRILSLLLTFAFVGLTLAGCGNPGSETQVGQTTTAAGENTGAPGESSSEPAGASQTTTPVTEEETDPAVTQETAEETDPSVTDPGTPTDDGDPSTPPAENVSPVAALYSDLVIQKSAVLSRLNDGLSQNPETSFYTFSLLGVMLIDLSFLPISFFGFAKEEMESGLDFLSEEEIVYTENGNTYRLEYKDAEGQVIVVQTVYDPMVNGMVSTLAIDGKEVLASHVRQTSYGYVAWYFLDSDEEAESYVYLVTVQGEDGVVGLSQPADKPAPLTGNEPIDYPKSATEWYAITGNRITGQSNDGTTFDFTFTPTTEEAVEG